MKKMGRPKVDNPKTYRTQIRFTEEEHRLLNDCAEKNNMTITQVIRDGALQYAENNAD